MMEISTWSFGRGWRIMATVTGAVMVSALLVAAPSVQDPEAVRALTAATGLPGAHGMVCTDERRRARGALRVRRALATALPGRLCGADACCILTTTRERPAP